MEEDKLLEVLSDRVDGVLSVLKEDWPSSIHMYYFIWMDFKWNGNGKLKNMKLYHYHNSEEELFLATSYIEISGLKLLRVMVHSFIKDLNKMKKLLLETDAIDWTVNPTFEGVLEKDLPVIEEICKIKNKLCSTDGLFNQVWLPLEKQENISVIIPPDMYIEKLTEEHAARINETWRYGSTANIEVVRVTILNYHGLGLFRKSDNRLVAWATVQHFAGIGMLYTEKEERGKGYGSLITLALAKYLVDIKVEPFACIRVSNTKSMIVFNKLGFHITDKVTWINTSDNKYITDA